MTNNKEPHITAVLIRAAIVSALGGLLFGFEFVVDFGLRIWQRPGYALDSLGLHAPKLKVLSR